MIRLQARSQFHSRRLKRKVDQGTFRSLGHAGGTIRKHAAFSIRKRQKPSRPGAPPHTQTGRLKRSIRYEVDRRTPGVVIGPINEIAGRIWNLHEFGGVARKRRKLKRHRFKIDEHGPIRVKSLGNAAKFARIKLLTAAQASRATRLIEEENARRGQSKPRRYPKRPFMKPALDANRSRLPKFWHNSVR